MWKFSGWILCASTDASCFSVFCLFIRLRQFHTLSHQYRWLCCWFEFFCMCVHVCILFLPLSLSCTVCGLASCGRSLWRCRQRPNTSSALIYSSNEEKRQRTSNTTFTFDFDHILHATSNPSNCKNTTHMHISSLYSHTFGFRSSTLDAFLCRRCDYFRYQNWWMNQ